MSLGQCLKPKAIFKGWSIEILSSFILSGRSGSTSCLWRVADTGDAQLWVHALLPPSLSPQASWAVCYDSGHATVHVCFLAHFPYSKATLSVYTSLL